jgi:hypothetical protein
VNKDALSVAVDIEASRLRGDVRRISKERFIKPFQRVKGKRGGERT